MAILPQTSPAPGHHLGPSLLPPALPLIFPKGSGLWNTAWAAGQMVGWTELRPLTLEWGASLPATPSQQEQQEGLGMPRGGWGAQAQQFSAAFSPGRDPGVPG